MPVTDEIRAKLSQVPHKPGVYLMKDRFGTVIYVGKARDLRRRISQYFHPSRRMGWDIKFNALVDSIYDFDVHVVRSEPEALLLEGKLIKELRPKYNVSFRDDKRFALLKVRLDDPIPGFVITRIEQNDGARYFGPFASTGALRRTLNLVRRKFNLRGCKAVTPTEHDYRHCLYAHLRVCTAPCIGNVTREQYMMQVLAACDFLDGECEEMARTLEDQMRQAAKNLDFEKAAELRDLITDIRRTTTRTGKYKRLPPNLPLASDPESEVAALAKALDLPAPPMRIEGFDISNISGTFKVASLVSFWRGRPDRSSYRRFRIKTVEGQNDLACVAETIRRRYSRLLRESGEPSAEDLQRLVDDISNAVQGKSTQTNEDAAAASIRASVPKPPSTLKPLLPDLIVIDGGRGQVNTAFEELQKLGLQGIPVIGLAKEFEEIYRPGDAPPLKLGIDHPAIKLLQRVRDEAHRVANSYNARLRLKKISESILDEFPGIGDARKQALLKRFGSVHRIRQATVEELASVPGIGTELAKGLLEFLARTRPQAPKLNQAKDQLPPTSA
ncbi:MAG: excinuclease ABC subunit UvrC [Verrucomicrobiae bacterium]|nr:excinuclease ABC subunit UvrC [Verrucomicrobiae bacterium]